MRGVCFLLFFLFLFDRGKYHLLVFICSVVNCFWTFVFPFIPSLIFFTFCPYLVLYTGPKVRGLLPGCSAPSEEEGKKNYYFHNFQDLLLKNLKCSRTLKTHEGPQINKPKRKEFIPMIGWVFVENALFSSF